MSHMVCSLSYTWYTCVNQIVILVTMTFFKANKELGVPM
jgi:hypothetical protein